MFDSSDDDDDEDDFHHPHHGHNPRDIRYDPAPHGTGFTLRMGGNAGPQISFRTIQSQFGSNSNSPAPHHPFGGGHVIGGISPNPRSAFPGSPFDHHHAQFPGAGARSMRPTPQPDQSSQQRDDPQQQQQQQRASPTATPNFGNSGQPIADMFASIIQSIVGTREDPQNHPRNQHFNPPGTFPGSRSPAAGQNNPGQGSSQADGLGGPGHSPGTVPSPGGWSHGGSPMGMPENPFFMQMPRGRGGVTYYSSTRTWTGPNGEVRTIRTSSPMPPHGQQGMPGDPAPMDLAEYVFWAFSTNRSYC